jgi:hypothetical protein
VGGAILLDDLFRPDPGRRNFYPPSWTSAGTRPAALYGGWFAAITARFRQRPGRTIGSSDGIGASDGALDFSASVEVSIQSLALAERRQTQRRVEAADLCGFDF